MYIVWKFTFSPFCDRFLFVVEQLYHKRNDDTEQPYSFQAIKNVTRVHDLFTRLLNSIVTK